MNYQTTLPGRTLDIQVAKQLFGIYCAKDDRRDREQWFLFDRNKKQLYGGCYPTSESCWQHAELPEYSTDIEAAWKVVELCRPYIKLDARGMGGDNGPEWMVTIWYGYGEVSVYAPSAPLAICRAALIANEDTHKNIERSKTI